MIEGLPVLFGAGIGSRIARSVVSNTQVSIGDFGALSQAISIGGVSFSPSAYMVADDIVPATGAWTSRHASKSMALAGSGAAPTYANDSAITNDTVNYSSAKYHAAADTSWGQLSDKDFAFESVFSVPGSGACNVCSTTGAVTTTKGFLLQVSGNIAYFYVGQTGSYAAMNSAAASVPSGALVHVFVGGDRSEKMYLCINGVYSASVDISAKTETLTNAALAIGAYGSSASNPSVISVATWDLTANPWPGAATNQATIAAIAAERFATISGIGCAKGTAYSFARASSAYVDRYVSGSERRLFFASPGWPRVCQREDLADRFYGYLSEPQCINEFLYSEDFSQAATWEPTRATVSSNAIAAPDGATTADGIVASADANTHYVQQSVASTATEHIFSVWAKRGAVDWLELSVPSVSQAFAYFDLANGALGTLGSGGNCHFIEDWGGGWYRCTFCYTGGAAAHYHRIGPAEADGDDSFTGDGATVSTYVWGAQHEDDGTVKASSYIKTTTGAATRVKDVLTRTISGMTTGKFVLSADFYGGPSYDNTAVLSLVSVDDASANNAIDISVTAADVANTAVTAGGSAQASVTGTQNITNDRWRSVAAKMRADSVKQLVDGTADGSEDTSATMPSGMTVLRIGCATTSNTGQPLGLLRNIKVLKDVI